jgi:hypothetical protein
VITRRRFIQGAGVGIAALLLPLPKIKSKPLPDLNDGLWHRIEWANGRARIDDVRVPARDVEKVIKIYRSYIKVPDFTHFRAYVRQEPNDVSWWDDVRRSA